MRIRKYAGGGINYLPSSNPQTVEEASQETSSSKSKVPGFADKLIDMIKTDGLDSDVSVFLKKVSNTLDLANDPSGENISLNEIIKITRDAKRVKSNYEDYSKARENLNTQQAWADMAMDSRGNLYVYDTGTKKIKTVSLTEFTDNKDNYLALTNEELLSQRRVNPTLAYNNSILDDVFGAVGMKTIVDYTSDLLKNFQDTEIEGYAIKNKTIQTGLNEIINGVLSNGNSLSSVIEAGPNGVYKISEKSTSADTNLQGALSYLISAMPTKYRHTLNARATIEGFSPEAFLLSMIETNTGRSLKIDFDDTATKAKSGKGSSGSEAMEKDTLANEFAIGALTETTAFISPRPDRVSATAMMALRAWNGGQLQDKDGKVLHMDNLEDLIPQVTQLSATNTSTVFFGNQKVSRAELASLVWDGQSLIKRVALPSKRENGELVPDFSLLIKINEVNKWVSETPGLTKVEINEKLKELGDSNIVFDEETGTFTAKNIGFFATFTAYASDKLMDLSKSKGFIEPVPRDEGRIIKEKFNNYVIYGKDDPSKKEVVRNNFKESRAGDFYIGNVYIPLEDPIQGFLMTNSRTRPKTEFSDPSKYNEAGQIIKAGEQASNWKFNF